MVQQQRRVNGTHQLSIHMFAHQHASLLHRRVYPFREVSTLVSNARKKNLHMASCAVEAGILQGGDGEREAALASDILPPQSISLELSTAKAFDHDLNLSVSSFPTPLSRERYELFLPNYRFTTIRSSRCNELLAMPGSG
jgi:hypothetical protein